MSRVPVRALPFRSIVLALLFAATTTGLPVSAAAQSRHARLSRDLSDRLAKGDQGTTAVIVTGTVPVETIATRYGARVLKVLRQGTVLEVNGGQLEALSRDADVDHLSGDVRVHRMSAETTAAIGADQVWQGVLGQGGRYSGAGIGIAVVDSGVAPGAGAAAAGSSRPSTSPAPGRSERIEYGHGTHVAGHHRRAPARRTRVWRPGRRSSTCGRSATTARARPAT